MFWLQLTDNPKINELIVYFFCKLPVNGIRWQQQFDDIPEEKQEELINKTVNSDLILRYPIGISYQKQFLKAFIGHLEIKESTIDNTVYNAIGRLVALPSNSCFHHVYYPIKFQKSDKLKLPLIILKENINIISEGTTGLRTWEASQALAEWVLQNPAYVEGKNILELGAGVGLTGLIVALLTNPSKYILTDCHPSVLSVLCENVKLNTSEHIDVKGEKCTDEIIFNNNFDSGRVQVRELFWGKTTNDSCKNFGSVDCIFAADVVYDKDLFEPLLNTLIEFFKTGTKEAFIACTERNSDTLKSFWQACGFKGLTVEFLTTPAPIHLTWQKDMPIFLSRINLAE